MEKLDRDEDSKIFPQRLMEILADRRSVGIIEWLPHGRAFVVKDRALFAEKIMPVYFSRHAKYSSFTRKLNRWNFVRVASGPEIGALYHEFFLRDKPYLTTQMYCKNARSKLAMSDESTPNPTAATVNSGCCSIVSGGGPILGSGSHDLHPPPAEKPDVPLAFGGAPAPPLPFPPLQGMGGGSVHPRLADPSNGLLLPDASWSSAPSYSLSPDIPLGLLELLSKEGNPPSSSDVATKTAPATTAAAQHAPVPSRLLQQSQYANLLLERQIQILQQEQAKFLLMRQTTLAAAARQQHPMRQPHVGHPNLMGPTASGVPPPQSLPPSAAASSASLQSSSSTSAVSSSQQATGSLPLQQQPLLSVSSALEQLRREDEERLCQLINLQLEQQWNLGERSHHQQRSQLSAAKNPPRASAA